MADCVIAGDLAVVDGEIGVPPGRITRAVATATAADVFQSWTSRRAAFSLSNIQAVTAQWTNNTPIATRVESRITRGQSIMRLATECSMDFILVDGMAVSSSPTLTERSRHGHFSWRSLLGGQPQFSQVDRRMATRTFYGAALVVQPGQTAYYRAQVNLSATRWNSRTPLADTVSDGNTGTLRVDLIAAPYL